MKTFEKVIDILKELSGMEEIKLEDNIQNDLALDSLLMVTLLIEIEDVFNITLEESDMNPFDLVVVQDVIELVDRYNGEDYE